MVEKIYRYMKDNYMLEGCSHIVVGISGGADSVSLLRVLDAIIKRYGLNIKLHGVHVNHGIRGEEAKRDEEFAAQLCRKLGVEYTSVHIDIPAMAKQQSLSEEEAGRIARYDIFEKKAKKLAEYMAGNVSENVSGNTIAERTDYNNSNNNQYYNCIRIAVAHHMNDQAETVLMNVMRGSSIKGLCGMQPVRNNIIRPLLGVTRHEIENYLFSIKQPYINDSTNNDVEYTRNKLRNIVIPYLEENINENVIKHVNDMSAAVSEAEEYISRKADKLYSESVYKKESHFIIKIENFGYEKVLQKYVIRKIIGELAGQLKDVYRTHIDSVLSLKEMQVGRQVNIAYSITAVRKYDSIEIYKTSAGKTAINSCITYEHGKSDEENIYNIDIDSSMIENLNYGEKFSVDVKKDVYTEAEELTKIEKVTFERVKSIEKSDRNGYTIYFDYDKIKKRMSLRNRREGDRIVVNSEGCIKKLKKEMVDRKIPREYRHKVLLLALEDEVLWLAGIRRGESAKVDKDSQRVIKVTIDK